MIRSTRSNMSMKESPKPGFWPGCLAPNFSANCVQSGEVFPVSLESFPGKMVLLLFYPIDFGYISPTEIVAVQDMMIELKKKNCEVLAISSGSVLSKVAFLSTPKYEGGLEGVEIGLLEDKEGLIARSYGVQRENSGYSFRSMVLIDMEGVVVARMLMDLSIGLGIKEALRLVKNTNCSESDASLGLREEESNFVKRNTREDNVEDPNQTTEEVMTDPKEPIDESQTKEVKAQIKESQNMEKKDPIKESQNKE